MLRLNTDTEFYWIGETNRTVRSLWEYTGRVASPESTLTLSSIELQEGDVLIGLGSEDQLGKLRVRTEKS